MQDVNGKTNCSRHADAVEVRDRGEVAEYETVQSAVGSDENKHFPGQFADLRSHGRNECSTEISAGQNGRCFRG